MKALIVIDIQNDFCEGGTLAVKDSNTIILPINRLIKKFQENGDLVVATKDWHPANHKYFKENIDSLRLEERVNYWPIHCVQNSFGAEFHQDLLPIKEIIYKGIDRDIDSYSGFFDNERLNETKLRELLEKNRVKELYVVGLATDYCVKYTVLDGLELGFKVNVIVDCCKAVNLSPSDEVEAIELMRKKGAEIFKSYDILL